MNRTLKEWLKEQIMNFSLTTELEEFIAKLVKSGLYQTGSEVVREALRLLKDRQDLQNMKLQQLKKDIQVGIDQGREGRISTLSVETIKKEGRKRRAAKRKAA